MRGIGIRVALIGIVIVAAVLLRPFVSGNAGNLGVGDCFDEPTTTSGTIKDVQHRPCTDAHDAEVVFVGDYQPSSGTMPSSEAFLTFYQSTCTPAFNTYTGLDFDTDEAYNMSAFRPTSEGWTGGDHKVICYAVRADGTKFSASIKKK